jgi:hypothetical protein
MMPPAWQHRGSPRANLFPMPNLQPMVFVFNEQ